MRELVTTDGAYGRNELGPILPHEHVFTDLGPPEAAAWRDADPAAVVDRMAPELERAREAGVTALVEATPEGVGRRVDVVEAAAAAAELPVVVATGAYQEPRIPDRLRALSEDELVEWLVGELTEGVGDTGVRAGWIKLSTDDDDPDGISEDERRLLRAAARAGAETGAAIGSHTLHGPLVERQLDVIEELYDPERFVWIHAQAVDADRHEAVAQRGAYVEYDWIGGEDQPDGRYLDLIERLIGAGHEEGLLLSQDRGWYDPSEPEGGEQRPYTYLPETFLPKLRERVGEATAGRLVTDNPFEAFSRPA